MNRLQDLGIKPTQSALGAEIIGIDLNQPMPGELIHRLIKLWEKYHVIFFRGQSVSAERHIQISQWFGPRHAGYKNMPILGDSTQPEMITISNVESDGLLGGGYIEPHQDGVYLPTPLAGAMMRAVEVPESGGDTSWSNLILAYQELPVMLKRKIRNLRVTATNIYAGKTSRTDLGGGKQFFAPDESPVYAHPLVRVHPATGKRILWVSPLNSERLEGIRNQVEANELLDTLKRHVDQHHLYYRHRWEAGDILIWDNRCCNHKRDAIPEGQRRVFYRTVIGGSRPF